MLEEDIDFQGRDQNVELPSEQEICVEMKTCNMSLPELSKAKENVHTNEVKLDMPIEQEKSNLHIKQKEVLGSKVIRRANPTKLVKREECRPPPKPPYILNINEEVIGVIEKVVSKTRLPLKPPTIHGSVNRERIGLEKEYLLNTVLNHRSPPELPPKRLRIQSDIMDKLNLKWEDNRLNISHFT